MHTKVILNKDLATLGEEGDVKHVARGYARNFLFPRGIAVPFSERTQKMFEARKDEIEARKMQKRKDAASVKERIEALNVVIVMPAGGNGRLYGAVTTQTLSDELAKSGFAIERKKIEIPGNVIKTAGKHKVVIKLYDNTVAELSVAVEAQQEKVEEKHAVTKRRSHRDEAASEVGTVAATDEPGETAAESSAELPSEQAVETTAETGAVADGEAAAES
jgi:large subunit ribosomal protein L9